jgi:hypothetical protein
MKVSGIHIAVNQYLALRQCSKGTDDAGLPGASFTA